VVDELEDLTTLLLSGPLHGSVLVEGNGKLGNLRTGLGQLDLGSSEDLVGISEAVGLRSRSTVGAGGE
jgi:hypothetical protein